MAASIREADIMLATLNFHFLSGVLPAQLEPQSQEVNNTKALKSVTSGQGMGRIEAVGSLSLSMLLFITTFSLFWAGWKHQPLVLLNSF